MAVRDPYQVLGVARTATQDEIRNAYRALAKKHHPDLNPGKKEAEQKFKEVSHAYELIGDPANRAKFDRGGEEGLGGDASRRAGHEGPFYYRTQQGRGGGRYSFSFGGGGAEDQDEFIESLLRGFGAAGGASGARRAPSRGEDVRYALEIGLREAVQGAEREVTFPDGKTLRLRIPAGVRSGMSLRLPGQGLSPGAGIPPGDALVELRVKPLAGFREEGDDLVTEVAIPLAEAVLGGEIRVPTVDGEVLLRVPRGVNTGTRMKLAGKGLFNRQRERRGDQIVILKVTLPVPVPAELEAAIRAWAQARAA
ncbi:MAG: J domain-containing protein [Oligoflexia bacterium]|nr:J domain-containing protein [Oligoflexia bacterium]